LKNDFSENEPLQTNNLRGRFSPKHHFFNSLLNDSVSFQLPDFLEKSGNFFGGHLPLRRTHHPPRSLPEEVTLTPEREYYKNESPQACH
jgi:hypothetical protein